MTTRQLFFSSFAVFFVVLCVAWSHNVASDTVSDGCEEKFYVSKFTNSNVIGLLGHPFGTIVRVTGVSLGEDDPPLKETKGKNRLRIDSVEGMQLKDPIYFYYGTRRDGLALKEIRSPGKDEQFDFYMLETGGFSGRAVIPKHLMSKSPNVSENRLSDLLAATGFRSASRWYGGYAWNHWNSMLGVTEWILIAFAGKKDEAVSANVGVGITQTLAFGISHELLVEVADVKQMVDEYGFWTPGRGQTIIETAEKAKAWERRVAETAPAAAECYALQHGNELLKRTTHARQRSSELMQLLDPTKSLYQQIQELEARHGHAYRKEAERLAECPGVMQVFDAEELYLLACCAVLTGDQGTALRGLDPLKNEELMWQIQLVADGILLWERETETTKEHGRV